MNIYTSLIHSIRKFSENTAKASSGFRFSGGLALTLPKDVGSFPAEGPGNTAPTLMLELPWLPFEPSVCLQSRPHRGGILE